MLDGVDWHSVLGLRRGLLGRQPRARAWVCAYARIGVGRAKEAHAKFWAPGEADFQSGAHGVVPVVSPSSRPRGRCRPSPSPSDKIRRDFRVQKMANALTEFDSKNPNIRRGGRGFRGSPSFKNRSRRSLAESITSRHVVCKLVLDERGVVM